MDRRRVKAVAAGVLAAVVLIPGAAVAQDATLKQDMAQNLALMQKILVALIYSDYASVPADAQAILEHAMHVAQLVPPSAEGQKQRYVSYAYNLQADAESLKSIAETLAKRDSQRAEGDAAELAVDYLREAAGAHYGGMVTMCVACHNNFRRKLVQ